MKILKLVNDFASLEAKEQQYINNVIHWKIENINDQNFVLVDLSEILLKFDNVQIRNHSVGFQKIIATGVYKDIVGLRCENCFWGFVENSIFDILIETNFYHILLEQWSFKHDS